MATIKTQFEILLEFLDLAQTKRQQNDMAQASRGRYFEKRMEI